MVSWHGCRNSPPRSTVRCSSGRRASRSCARRSATAPRRRATGAPPPPSPPRCLPARTSCACTPWPRWRRWCGWRRRYDEASLIPDMHWLTSVLRRPPIGWWDLLDILVVSILIYEVLKLIRGTRAAQMVLGGAVLITLLYGSRWGHLETLN